MKIGCSSNVLLSKALNGFTLIEHLCVLALMGIIAVWAIPSWQDFRLRWQSRLVMDQLESAWRWSQAEALFSGRQIRWLPHMEGQWSKGFSINASNGPLRDISFRMGQGTLTWHGFGRNGRIFYDPSQAFSASNGHFMYCYQRDRRYTRAWVVNAVGRTRLLSPTEVPSEWHADCR